MSGSLWRILAVAIIAVFVKPVIARADEMTAVFDQLLSNPDTPPHGGGIKSPGPGGDTPSLNSIVGGGNR